ncbi:hydrogenase expression/formation protein HypE [Candidatus Bipolaricaulota bacterium]|nr:hydrogenase expression/formation protein HypE [Candidatus Bipolaricaulota bacterium]
MTQSNDRISPLHGAGGEVMGKLLAEHVLPHFAKSSVGRIDLSAMDDGATIQLPTVGELVMTTDSHVVKPIFFPGGDIGTLAAAGTLNDLAVMGAKPLALSLAVIIEEDFLISDIDRIVQSFADTLAGSEATLICGDTKVMGRGEIDGIAINTTGIGIADPAIGDAGALPGDVIIVTGTMGDHGMALLAAREEFRLETELVSDVASVWPMIRSVLPIGGIRAMKDPTRGGLAAALNEMARKSGTTIEMNQSDIPIRGAVQGLSDLLGISPLEVANEGKAVLIVDPASANQILETLRRHPLGRDAAIIGRVGTEYPGRVVVTTTVGGRRFLDMPLGDPVPRIC